MSAICFVHLRSRFLACLAVGLVAFLAGCQPLIVPPETGTPAADVVATPGDAAPTVLRGVVATFLVTERPRVIVLEQPIDGFANVLIDEDAEGVVNTKVYSMNGCPLAGPPIVAGDIVEVSGRAKDSSTLVADVIRLLNVEIDAECK